MKTCLHTPALLLSIQLPISPFLLADMFKSQKKSHSVEGQRTEESEAIEAEPGPGYKELCFTFPKKSNDEIHFNDRTKDNLPDAIKGVAEWRVRQDFHQSSYLLRGESKVQAIKYISNQ